MLTQPALIRCGDDSDTKSLAPRLFAAGASSVWCPQEKLLSLKTCGRIMELQVPRLSAAAGDSKCDHFPAPLRRAASVLMGGCLATMPPEKAKHIYKPCISYYKSLLLPISG